MKTLDRYVVKELLVPLLIGTIVFALLFVANDMIAIYKTFNVEAVPFRAILQLLLLKFPVWLSVTFPIGSSLGASLAISRLARESEITAMRAAGVPVRRVFMPLLFVGAVMGVGNFLIVERWVPPASQSYKKLLTEVGFLAGIPQFRSNVNLNLGRYSASFGSVARGDRGVVELREIVLFERPRPGEVIIYNSKEGSYDDGVWNVQSPYVVHLKGTTLLTASTRDTIKIFEQIRVSDIFAQPSPEEESVEELVTAIRQFREMGQPTTNLEIAFHQKFSVPVACLVFAFTGAVLAMRFSKAGPFIGVMVSLGLVWAYFNVYVISGEVLGKNGWASPILAAWLPNLLFGLFGLILVRRLE